MGQWHSNVDQDIDSLPQLISETGFNRSEIQFLWKRFKQLDKDKKGFLTRADFLRIVELTINPIGDRIVHSFFIDGQSETVSFLVFLRILARFRPMDNRDQGLNSKEEKLRFIFRLYDLNDDNKISSEELFDILMMLTSETIPVYEIRGIVQQSINEAVDTNGENQITFQDFYQVMKDEHIADKMCFKFGHGR